MLSAEKELAEIALRQRSCNDDLRRFIYRERNDLNDYNRAPNYAEYALVPLHHDASAWIYVGDDPQLAMTIEEIVNTFSPTLSVELLLYNVLGSNSDSCTCLVRYLVEYYSSNRLFDHIKTTLRNMIRWTVLAGFVPCTFVPWKKLRNSCIGVSAKSTIVNLMPPPTPRSANSRHCTHISEHTTRRSQATVLYNNERKKPHKITMTQRRVQTKRFIVLQDSLDTHEAALEAVQERAAHDRVTPAVLRVSLNTLPDTLRTLMKNSVPVTLLEIVIKIISDWISRDDTLSRDPIRETELKLAIVALWGVMKTFEHGRCPLIPECNASSCIAFYDEHTGLVTAGVEGVLYTRALIWDSSWTLGSETSTLAKRVQSTVKNWDLLFRSVTEGLAASSTSRTYTSNTNDRSSLAYLADAMLAAKRDDGSDAAPSAAMSGVGSTGRSLLDGVSRFITREQQPDLFGNPANALPTDFLLRANVNKSVSEHKAASVSHSLSKMLSTMITEGQELNSIKKFINNVMIQPHVALQTFRRECTDKGLITKAENITSKCDELITKTNKTTPITDLGPDVKLVCSYPSSVTVAHLEEILSLWSNFWRSALSGFSQFSRRHNTIQYNTRDAMRELESGSPVHIFHNILVTLLNTSGVTFADSLSGRRPDNTLTVNDIMLTRDSLHPTAYGLLLANKLGLRPSDVKCQYELNKEDPLRVMYTTPNIGYDSCTTTSRDISRDVRQQQNCYRSRSPLTRRDNRLTVAQSPTKRARSRDYCRAPEKKN